MIKKDADPVDIGACLNRLLTVEYVPMPDKRKEKKRKKRDSSIAATHATESVIGEGGATIQCGDLRIVYSLVVHFSWPGYKRFAGPLLERLWARQGGCFQSRE
jgi:hypothetical protein